MYLCGPGKHNCQPFCGPEGRFYCSDSVCSLWPAPFSYLCVSVMILCVLKTVCGWTSKNWLPPPPAVVSTLLTPLPVSCPLTTPHHYIFNCEDEHNVQVIGQRFGWVEYAVETAGGRYVKGSWVKSVFVMVESVLDAFTKSAQRLKIRPFLFFYFLYKTLVYCWLLSKGDFSHRKCAHSCLCSLN